MLFIVSMRVLKSSNEVSVQGNILWQNKDDESGKKINNDRYSTDSGLITATIRFTGT